MRTFLLTSLSIIAILLIFSVVRIKLPPKPMYILDENSGLFGLFNITEHLKKYDRLRESISYQQISLSEDFRASNPQMKADVVYQAREYLFSTMRDSLIPFWYETPWDFNGTTEVPRKGNIACGYFVTTIIRHAGFDIDKYHLARQAASVLIDSLCAPPSIERFSKNNYEGFVNYMKCQHDGIYIVGLDTHVGFVVKHEGKIHFIHSSKPDYIGVVREDVEESRSLQRSKVFVVGNLLENEQLIKRWLQPKPEEIELTLSLGKILLVSAWAMRS